MSARIAQAQGDERIVRFSETEIMEIVRGDSLPFSFSEMAAQLRASIKLDRPLLQERLWRMIRAWQRLEADGAEIALLRQVRASLAMVHCLNIEKQKRSQIPDSEVLRSEFELIRQDMALLLKRVEYRMIMIELLEYGNYLKLDEGATGIASLRHPSLSATGDSTRNDEEKKAGEEGR